MFMKIFLDTIDILHHNFDYKNDFIIVDLNPIKQACGINVSGCCSRHLFKKCSSYIT